MNGVVCSEDFNESVLKEDLNNYPSMEGMDLAKIVSTKNEYIFSKKGAKKVAVLDFGVKKNILNIFQKLDCCVTVLPANTSAEKILDLNPCLLYTSDAATTPYV